MRERWRGAAGVAWLVGLLGYLFQDLIFRGRVLYERDIHTVWQPQIEAFVRSIAAGSWPVWDASIGFGQPLLADPGAQILYPFTWLNLILPAGLSYTLYALGHLLFSGIGMMLLGRRLGMSRPAAWCAAAFWMSSGPSLALVNLWHHFAGAMWMPWILLAALRALSTGRATIAVVWGLASAMQAFAGSADMCLMTHGVTAVLLVTRLVRPETGESRSRSFRQVAIGASVTILAASGQWLPSLAVARQSFRWALPSATQTYWSVHPFTLFELLLPLRLEVLPLQDGLRLALFEAREAFMHSLYLGGPLVPLVVAGLLGWRHRYRAALGTVLVLGVVVTLGKHTPLYDLATTLVPPLGILRYPVKAVVVVSFAWALLAGVGLDVWSREARRAQRWALLSGSAISAVGLGLAYLGWFHASAVGAWLLELPRQADSFSEVLRGTSIAVAVSAALGAGVVLALFASRRLQLVPLVFVAGAVGSLELALNGMELNPTAPAELLEMRSPLLPVLQRAPPRRSYVYDYLVFRAKSRYYLGRPSPYRLADPEAQVEQSVALAAAARQYPVPATGGAWGLEYAYDLDMRGLYRNEHRELTLALRAVEGSPAHTRLLQLGNTGFVVTLHEKNLADLEPLIEVAGLFPEPMRVFAVPDPLPRAYAVGGVRGGKPGVGALIAADFDPREEAFISGVEPRPAPAGFEASVEIVERRPDRMRLAVELSHPGYVVVVDGFHEGWRASVDGHATETLRANAIFRAVAAPAGAHEIELVYRPGAVLAGLSISALAWLACGLGLTGAWREKRSTA